MSITRAMYSGVSGLSTEGATLSVLGDNIANVNTVGFKSQRAQFADVLGSSIMGSGTGSQSGSGVRLAEVEQVFKQGSISNTGVATDVALTGDGFFVLAQHRGSLWQLLCACGPVPGRQRRAAGQSRRAARAGLSRNAQ